MCALFTYIDIAFNLTETGESSRLFFNRNNRDDLIGEGMFQFVRANETVVTTIEVFVDVSTLIHL